MKTSTIHPREFVAWIVLAFAVALFTVSIAFAQDSKTKDADKVHIKVEKIVNGKTEKVDTTVSRKDLPALKEYLKGKNIDLETDNHHGGDHRMKKDEDIVMNFDHSKMSKEDRQQFERDMERLHKEMGKLKDEMKNIHIEINGDDEEDGKNMDFHFKMPKGAPMPPVPPSPHGYSYSFRDGDEGDEEDNDGGNFHLRSFSFDDDIPDSLNDEAHIVIRGREGEGKPELEKEITGKHGEKIFVFKRKLPTESVKAAAIMKISHLKAYPNPSDGKISLSFVAASKSDVQVSVTDGSGKEVFTKTLKDFEGEYFEQIDISSKGKGAYFVKVTAGDDSLSKKILIE